MSSSTSVTQPCKRGGNGVVGLQQGPPELAWAARSECILKPVTHMDLNQSARGFLYARGYPHDSA